MTPERALTISRVLAFNWEHDDESLSVLADRIRDAILQACAEEREACAKIALASQSSAGYDICQIIRGGKTDSEWRRAGIAQQNIESLLAKILELQKENELLRSAKPNMATSLVKMARQIEEYEKAAAIRGGA